MKILPGFFALNVASITCQTVAWALNLLLLNLIRKTPAKMDVITVRFTIAFVIVALNYATAQALVQPFVITSDGLGLTMAASFLHDTVVVKYVMCILLSPTYAAMVQLCAFNFLYKYAVTCSPKLRHYFDNFVFVGGILIAFSISAAAYLVLMLTVAEPTPSLRETVADKLNDIYQTDFRVVYFAGVDDTVPPNPVMSFFIVFSFAVVAGSFVTIFVCGYRIWRMVYSNKLSGRTRSLHKRTLKMLSLQTFNPFIFMIIPGLLPTVFIKSGLTSGVLSYFSAYALMLFPLINPIIVISYTSDYKRAVLRMLYKNATAIGSLELPSRPEQSTHFTLATRGIKDISIKI